MSEYVTGNPNEGKSPHGFYNGRIPKWMLEQAKKGNRGFKLLAKMA